MDNYPLLARLLVLTSLSMIVPIPTLTFAFNISFGRTKDTEQKAELSATDASCFCDPPLLLMLIAIVMLSSAVVVYAARY